MGWSHSPLVAPRWFSATVSLLALAVAPLALAQGNLLYKCVDSAGKVSIQSNACPPGSTQAWRRPATPEPALTPAGKAAAQAKLERDQQRVRELQDVVDKKFREATSPSMAAPPTAADAAAAAVPAGSSPIANDPCQVAQAFANSVREKTWFEMSDDQTRRMFAWVQEQCKVKPAIDD